jgi:hypothetical protein
MNLLGAISVKISEFPSNGSVRTKMIYLVLGMVFPAIGVWIVFSTQTTSLSEQAVIEQFERIAAAENVPPAEVCFALKEDPNKVVILLDGQPVAAYCYAPEQAKPYIAPLCLPSGRALTRPVDGSASVDHPHHQGLFLAYGDVNGVDFWGNQGTLPQIRHVGFVDRGVDDAGRTVTLEVVLHWVDRQGATLLEERRKMRFFGVQNGFCIDFESRLEAVEAVRFGDTKEGMFALRLADDLREKGGRGRFYSASGKRGAAAVWGTQDSWVCLAAGEGEGAVLVGIKPLGNSLGRPFFWHVRDYGLFSANPLGWAAFGADRDNPDGLGRDIWLPAGNALKMGFRVVILELKNC